MSHISDLNCHAGTTRGLSIWSARVFIRRHCTLSPPILDLLHYFLSLWKFFSAKPKGQVPCRWLLVQWLGSSGFTATTQSNFWLRTQALWLQAIAGGGQTLVTYLSGDTKRRVGVWSQESAAEESPRTLQGAGGRGQGCYSPGPSGTAHTSSVSCYLQSQARKSGACSPLLLPLQ